MNLQRLSLIFKRCFARSRYYLSICAIFVCLYSKLIQIHTPYFCDISAFACGICAKYAFIYICQLFAVLRRGCRSLSLTVLHFSARIRDFVHGLIKAWKKRYVRFGNADVSRRIYMQEFQVPGGMWDETYLEDIENPERC